MPIDDRDWYRERQKKTLEKILDESDKPSAIDRIKQAIYNPKEFRSADIDETPKKKHQAYKSFLVVTLLFFVLVALVDYSRKEFVWQFIEREGKFRHLDKRSDNERKLDAQVDEWKENKGLEMGVCRDDAYASAEDISQFSKKVDLFLKKVAVAKKRYQVDNLDLSETQASLESISREGNALISFYNNKLVACYANQATADLVSKQAKAVNTSINDLSKSFKKISAEK
jgi:hypothetical protein